MWMFVQVFVHKRNTFRVYTYEKNILVGYLKYFNRKMSRVSKG